MSTTYVVIVLVALITAVILYWALPRLFYEFVVSGLRRQAGMRKAALRVNGQRMVYMQGGRGDTVVLIHGFGAEKADWLPVAKFLTPHYRVLILDLPGFGESQRDWQTKYDISSQAERLHTFIQQLTLAPCHIMGISMGGHIAATYAARYTQTLRSVTLMANAGIRAPEKSEFYLAIQEKRNPLLINSVDDLERFRAFIMTKRKPLPKLLAKYLGKRALRNRAFNAKVFQDIQEHYVHLEPELPKISAPTLIIWGEQDRVFHVSTVKVMEPLLLNSQSVVFKNCGHVPMLEYPRETAEHYLRFLQENFKNT